jgi:hypothetical protein
VYTRQRRRLETSRTGRNPGVTNVSEPNTAAFLIAKVDDQPASMETPPAAASSTRKPDARRLSTDEQRARNRLVVKRCYYRKIVRRPLTSKRVASCGHYRC